MGDGRDAVLHTHPETESRHIYEVRPETHRLCVQHEAATLAAIADDNLVEPAILVGLHAPLVPADLGAMLDRLAHDHTRSFGFAPFRQYIRTALSRST